MTEAMKRTWQTRITAIAGIAVITVAAMYLQIDGVLVPILGTAGISGVAGYDLGMEQAKNVAERINGNER